MSYLLLPTPQILIQIGCIVSFPAFGYYWTIVFLGPCRSQSFLFSTFIVNFVFQEEISQQGFFFIYSASFLIISWVWNLHLSWIPTIIFKKLPLELNPLCLNCLKVSVLMFQLLSTHEWNVVLQLFLLKIQPIILFSSVKSIRYLTISAFLSICHLITKSYEFYLIITDRFDFFSPLLLYFRSGQVKWRPPLCQHFFAISFLLFSSPNARRTLWLEKAKKK